MSCELREEDKEESSAGFCYSPSNNPPIQTHILSTQIQGYESNNSTMEMVGFPKHLQQLHPSQPGPSYSKMMMMNESNSDYYFTNNKQEYFRTQLPPDDAEWQESRMVADDSLVRSVSVFPCERNERPSQGLSLSLSSTNPSSIGLQAFELRSQSTHDELMRFGPNSSAYSINTSACRDGFVGKSSTFYHQGEVHQLKNSKYLGPAQALLNEFCSLENDELVKKPFKYKPLGDDHDIGSTRKELSTLHSLDFMELQKRKGKLLLMLEEVDKRYKHYRDQLKAVMESFEAVAGDGTGNVYSRLASKAMSKHFRCLRDAIMEQIQVTKNAMGENKGKKNGVVPGMSKGETPRLKVVDQSFRQRRALQQMNMMENHPWRPQRGLPERSVSVLRAWLFEHFLHPYPTDVDKHILARQTGLSRSQVSNWFINARVRLWKSMVEEMYLEELKEDDDHDLHATTSSDHHHERVQEEINPHQSTSDGVDQKPNPEQLALRPDSDQCLSSIINNHHDRNPDHTNVIRMSKKCPIQNMNSMHQNNPSFGTFGSAHVDLDFSSYNNESSSLNNNFNGGGGVSLTLGLQQHGGSGVSLAFASPSSSSHQSSLFYPREHIEDCQQVHQYSLIDGEAQNLPYRNLMGAQLLHDFAG